MKKIAADKNYRMLKSAQDYKAECAKKIEKAKSDGYWPLKKAVFRDAKGNALIIFQRNYGVQHVNIDVSERNS